MGPWNSMRRISRIPNYQMKPWQATSSFHSSQATYSNVDYHTLGLAENATVDEIKAAYFSKAKQYHPDSSSKSGETGGAEFQKLNEAYKRLMYKSKFASENKYHQDPIGQRHDHHDPRNYRHGPQNYRNPDPKYYSHGPENPWNEKNNSHRDPRNSRQTGHSWNNPWDRMHDDTKINEKEKGILRFSFLQLIIGVIFIQCLSLQLSLGPSQYSPNCQCNRCSEVRKLESEQAKHL
eukprot:GFUD01007182.1.p1 GENE.GFUD01007182.1~~GFUD01007182.1.p1  ORF type:complete len:235 (+),score=31.15 GFUD01007182.1:77-781(+)